MLIIAFLVRFWPFGFTWLARGSVVVVAAVVASWALFIVFVFFVRPVLGLWAGLWGRVSFFVSGRVPFHWTGLLFWWLCKLFLSHTVVHLLLLTGCVWLVRLLLPVIDLVYIDSRTTLIYALVIECLVKISHVLLPIHGVLLVKLLFFGKFLAVLFILLQHLFVALGYIFFFRVQAALSFLLLLRYFFHSNASLPVPFVFCFHELAYDSGWLFLLDDFLLELLFLLLDFIIDLIILVDCRVLKHVFGLNVYLFIHFLLVDLFKNFWLHQGRPKDALILLRHLRIFLFCIFAQFSPHLDVSTNQINILWYKYNNKVLSETQIMCEYASGGDCDACIEAQIKVISN